MIDIDNTDLSVQDLIDNGFDISDNTVFAIEHSMFEDVIVLEEEMFNV